MIIWGFSRAKTCKHKFECVGASILDPVHQWRHNISETAVSPLKRISIKYLIFCCLQRPGKLDNGECWKHSQLASVAKIHWQHVTQELHKRRWSSTEIVNPWVRCFNLEYILESTTFSLTNVHSRKRSFKYHILSRLIDERSKLISNYHVSHVTI